jgi:pyruvate kinase
MRRAKIICTLGPSCDSRQAIAALIRAGMNVARLNFSHGTRREHQKRLQLVRSVAAELGRPVAILQDIQGPKLRVGRFKKGSIELKDGAQVTLVARDVLGGGSTIPTPNRWLPKAVKVGDPILLDDGKLRLLVLAVRGAEVTCRVIAGGALSDHKGINLPQARRAVSALTEKDKADLAFGQRIGVDFVALSFVRSAEDLRQARRHMARLKTPLIAKIEKPQAVAHLEQIAAEADGIMLARGDLGVELPLERLPLIQKDALRLVHRMGRIAIVATEMLESMIHNPRPTRAEVSDVANAILDGADAVMLSAETAAGKFPIESVQMMSRIVTEAEKRVAQLGAPLEQSRDIATSVAAAAVAAASRLKIGLIVAYTESGHTAQCISEFRPNVRILGLTPKREIVRRMALYWGVEARMVDRLRSTDAMLRQVRRICRQARLCEPGTPVVIVAGVPLNVPGNTNMMTVHRM